MNAPSSSAAPLPRAKIRRQSKFNLVWLIPVIAAAAAAWLIFNSVRQSGPLITIEFNEANDMKANQTMLRYRGVRVGDVRSVKLSRDSQHVEVQVRLDKSAENLARDGSLFWIVRPEVGAGGLHGLETIVSGPYLQVQPGTGAPQKKFTGAERPPISKTSGALEIIVTTPQIRTLNAGSPVFYRGLEVGKVLYLALGEDSTLANVHLLIETNFAPLVRADSKFWNAGGINVDLKLFGINFNAESLKSMVIGGIAFATPPPPGILATNGTVFPLNEKLDEKWLKWSPVITITNANANAPQNSPSALLLNSVNPDSSK